MSRKCRSMHGIIGAAMHPQAYFPCYHASGHQIKRLDRPVSIFAPMHGVPTIHTDVIYHCSLRSVAHHGPCSLRAAGGSLFQGLCLPKMSLAGSFYTSLNVLLLRISVVLLSSDVWISSLESDRVSNCHLNRATPTFLGRPTILVMC